MKSNTMKKIVAICTLGLLTITSVFAQVDRSVMPKPGKARTPKIASYETFTLENGLQVFVIENHKLPKVTFSLVLNNDPIVEGDKAGYTSLAGSLIKAGTKTMTKDEINEKIDFMGANLSTSASGIYASCLSRYTADVVSIMADVVINPTFPAEEFEKEKKLLEGSAKRNQDDPSAISGNIYGATLFGKEHAYGEFLTLSSVEIITLKDCKNYYNTYFKPNVAYLAIVGDISLAEAKKLATTKFGAWSKGTVPTNKITKAASTAGSQVTIVDRASSVQSVLKIGNVVDYNVTKEDYFAAKIANHILGGGSSGRLFQNLREDKAYTYGAYSGLSSDEYVGKFTASAQVRTEVTDSAITEFLTEIKRMCTEDVSAKALQDAKNEIAGSFGRSLEQAQTVASFAINIANYKLSKDFYNNYLTNLDKVTIADVKAAAKKYFNVNNLDIVVVGKGTELADKLKAFDADGEVTILDSEGNETELVTIRPIEGDVTVEEVFNKRIMAFTQTSDLKSANKKLKKLKDVTTKGQATIQGAAIDVLTYKKAPNKIAVNIMYQGTVVQKQTYNGTAGKSVSMQGKKDMEGDELDEMKIQASFTPERLYKDNGYAVELLGLEEVNGSDAYVVSVSKGDATSKVYYDVKSGLQVKSLTTAKDAEGNEVTSITTFSDFKVVDGYMFSHKTSIDGAQALDIVISEVSVNSKLSDDLFN